MSMEESKEQKAAQTMKQFLARLDEYRANRGPVTPEEQARLDELTKYWEEMMVD